MTSEQDHLREKDADRRDPGSSKSQPLLSPRWCFWDNRLVARTVVSAGRGIRFKSRGSTLYSDPVGNGWALWGSGRKQARRRYKFTL